MKGMAPRANPNDTQFLNDTQFKEKKVSLTEAKSHLILKSEKRF